MRFPAIPGWGPPAAAVAVSVGSGGGRVGGFPGSVCLWDGACAWCLCWCVCCVFVVVVWVRVCLPFVLVCVCVRVWCVVVGFSGWGLLLVQVWVWLVCAVVGPSPLLAEVPECSWLGFAAGGGGCSSPLLAEDPRCGSPPLLAGVRWRWWCVVAGPSWPRVLVVVPGHSWLGSAGCDSGHLRGVRSNIVTFNATYVDMGGAPTNQAMCDYINSRNRRVLQQQVFVAAGMRARLIRNVNIQNRLVNSTMVVIKRWSNNVIVVCPIGRTREYPICRFQQIIPVYGPSMQVRTLQFPMLAGYACIAHGSQGCSYRIVWIDMATFFAAAHAYVALSRARSLQGLYILN